MVAGTKTINNQAMSVSADDDAAKKNTDCVYFLASPLTCKKGSECEYRHSEPARVNPRDCWYWLNGSCLNPKCAFRHPPLDGLLGSQSSVSAGTAFPLPQAATPSPLAAPQSKQPVPCIFFQKGLCLKGDKCAFMHGPNSVTTKHPPVAPPTADITGPKSLFGVPQRSVQEPKLYQPNISNSNKFTNVKLDHKTSGAQMKADAAKRLELPSTGFGDRSPGYKSNTIAPLSNGVHQHEMPEDYIMHNGKDADDIYRESSPGFDVLVDDELAQDQYYDVDQYGGTRGGHEGRNVDEYVAPPNVGREMFQDPRDYDVHDGLVSQHSRYQNRRSSDRISRGMDSVERWNDRNGGSSERIGQSDLRNRLKLKRESGLRSVISHDYSRDNHERRSSDSRRDSRPVAPLEGSLSSRLQGRIKDPRRSPMRVSVSGRDFEVGRNMSRTSPVRSQIRDRIGSRVQDDFGSERHSRGYMMRKEETEDGGGEFSGPKRLWDLKSCKSSVKDRLISGQESFSLGKRKSTGEHEQLNSDVSFEGPKPLSEILKRKKRSEVCAPVSGLTENKETDKTEVTENADTAKEEYISVTNASDKNIEPNDLQPSEARSTDQNDQEEGVLVDEGMEDQNLEGYEQGEDGEEYYYYEEDDGEYNLEEGENAEGGEYVVEEDGDHDLEKKIGGTFS